MGSACAGLGTAPAHGHRCMSIPRLHSHVPFLTLQTGACPPARRGWVVTFFKSPCCSFALIRSQSALCQSCFLLLSATGGFNHVILMPGINMASSSSSTCQIRKVLPCLQMSEVRAACSRQEAEPQWRPGGKGGKTISTSVESLHRWCCS